MSQQEILNLFYNELITYSGAALGNRVGDNVEPDNSGFPHAIYFVVTDQDEVLLGDGRINNTNIQVSWFGKKSESVKTIRSISDSFVEDIDGVTLSNGMSVRVINKGFATTNDVNDPNIQIITEFQIQ